MNGIHDLGGMDGFGRIEAEENEPVFHEAWEGHAVAISGLSMAAGVYNVDEIRHAIERIPPAQYLATSYYEHWILGFETLLVEKGAISRHELQQRWAKLEATE